MDIEFHPDGSLYVATRRDIHRMRDSDEDGKADKIELIVKLDTKGTYPHNGLSGLSWNLDGTLNFGLGENLGENYTLIGTDGAELSGGGEGGSTYVVRSNGAGLRRVSTGWWNPYGTCVDSFGHVFGTDNDPGASPPCRLIQIVEGGDYGYQYRYGRSGLHPLICWNGEIPGTLPMISGTGEAPCHIVSYEAFAFPEEYVGNLFVPCWADHRVERYTISQELKKGLVDAKRDILVEGPDDFRPVGIDVAPDGSVYISDWVSSSYPLHKQGRIWRIQSTTGKPNRLQGVRRFSGIPIPQLEEGTTVLLEFFDREASHDPRFFHVAVQGFSNSVSKTHSGLAHGKYGLPVLLAARRNPKMRAYYAREALDLFLTAPDSNVRFAAVKWIADDRLIDYRPDLEKMLDARDLDYRLFRAVAAALDRLDGKKPTDHPPAELLLKKITDEDAPLAIRKLCLREIDPAAEGLKMDHLKSLIEHPDEMLRVETVRTLAATKDVQRGVALMMIAGDAQQPASVRAEALAGLASEAEGHLDVLLEFALESSGELQAEALRSLIGVELVDKQRQALAALGKTAPDTEEAIRRILDTSIGQRPTKEKIDEWQDLLNSDGDPSAGERIFFGTKVGTCSKCHTIDGRGNAVGPDLSAMRKRVASEGDAGVAWLLETILQPSKDMAPQYTPWQIVTTDGKTLTGLPRRKGGNAEAYLGLDGKEFTVKKPDIEFRHESPTSVMPEGLLQNLTRKELNDLFAFIGNGSRHQ
jgi:hypothetical protein